MSRWLWALLAGVVLVAIAAVFWIASNQTNVHPRSRGAQRQSHLRPLPPLLRRTPRPRLHPHLRPRPRRRRQPRPLRLRRPMQDSKPPRRPLRPRRPPKSPRLPQSSRRSLRPRLLRLRPPKRRCRHPRPDGRRRKSRAYMRPRALRSWSGPGPIPRRIASGSSSGAAAAGPIGEPVDKFAQAAIVESPKKILLPSAICRIEGASLVEGMLKVSADCEDSISYTSRSVMIALRSTTELVYSASGDAALATTLKKCAP